LAATRPPMPAPTTIACIPSEPFMAIPQKVFGK
jgi:hypothetical protein